MTRAEPWVHGELPWLSGPLYRVHHDAWSVVDDFLRLWNYRRVQLDGRAMTSRFQAHTELHAGFGFPDWCGHGWDAGNECFGATGRTSTARTDRSTSYAADVIR